MLLPFLMNTVYANAAAAPIAVLTPQEKTFETYRPQNDSQRDAVEVIHKFLENPQQVGLLIMGPVGVGKSHLGSAVVHDLRKRGQSVEKFDRNRKIKTIYGDGPVEIEWLKYFEESDANFFVIDDIVNDDIVSAIVQLSKKLEDDLKSYIKFILLSNIPLPNGYSNPQHVARYFQVLKIEGKDFLNPNSTVAPADTVSALNSADEFEKEIETHLAEAPPHVKAFVRDQLEKSKKSLFGDDKGLERIKIIYRLPWGKFSRGNASLPEIRQKLQERTFNEEAKREMLRAIATEIRLAGKQDARKTILCFVGKPGVGKSTYAEFVAEAMGKKFVRVPLAQVTKPEHLVGYSYTYQGSQPGMIITSLLKAGAMDPVMLLDEMDKLKDHPDALNAFINILDGAFLDKFEDAYMGFELNLTPITFIATANKREDIPPALQSRMKVIEIGEYSFEQRVDILRGKVSKIVEECGLSKDGYPKLEVSDRYIRALALNHLDQEAGLRQTETVLKGQVEEIGMQFDLGECTEEEFKLDAYPMSIEPEHRAEPGTCMLLSVNSGSGAGTASNCRVMDSESEDHFYGFDADRTLNQNYVLEIFRRLNPEAQGKHFNVFLDTDLSKLEGRSAELGQYIALKSASKESAECVVAATGQVAMDGSVDPIGAILTKCVTAYKSGAKKFFYPASNNAELSQIADMIEGMELKPVGHVSEIEL